MVTKEETKREEELKCIERYDKREAPLGGLPGSVSGKGAGWGAAACGRAPACPLSADAGWGRGDATACPRKSGEGAAAAKCGRGHDAFFGEQDGAFMQRDKGGIVWVGGGLRPAAPRKSGKGADAAKCGRGLDAFFGGAAGRKVAASHSRKQATSIEP